jgi:hypothetical protein
MEICKKACCNLKNPREDSRRLRQKPLKNQAIPAFWPFGVGPAETVQKKLKNH